MNTTEAHYRDVNIGSGNGLVPPRQCWLRCVSPYGVTGLQCVKLEWASLVFFMPQIMECPNKSCCGNNTPPPSYTHTAVAAASGFSVKLSSLTLYEMDSCLKCKSHNICIVYHSSTLMAQVMKMLPHGRQEPAYPEKKSWLLMPWLLASPGQQQPWHWLWSSGIFQHQLQKG